MTAKVRQKEMTFQLACTIEADGMTIPPGTYVGSKKEFRASHMGQIIWQNPEYRLYLPGSLRETFLFVEVDVTSHVADGKVSVE